ncbi:polysaccharide deacetylase family protein [Synechococcus elongatus]|uniref:polysaccharide deacetylase family protein n=1 Tax=Synechococcus elongatus TaxID=32046 RepID=UPI000F7D64FD|nr:polysaccharide deacetylase family protein [Synechococcus elongatus]
MKIKLIDQIIIGFLAFSVTLFVVSAGNIVLSLLNPLPSTIQMPSTDKTDSKIVIEDPDLELSKEPKEPKKLVNLNFKNSTFVLSKISFEGIVLTFDDGPNDQYTEQILDILKKYKVKATFFVVGDAIKNRCRLIKRMIEEKHEVGNHSNSHPYFTLIDEEKQKLEIENTNSEIHNCQPNYVIQWFRPPYGRSNESTEKILANMGLNSALWTVDTDDWSKSSNYDTILETLLLSQKKDIILMHDGAIPLPTESEDIPQEIGGKIQILRNKFSESRQATVDALEDFLKENRQRKKPLTFVTLSEAFNLFN